MLLFVHYFPEISVIAAKSDTKGSLPVYRLISTLVIDGDLVHLLGFRFQARSLTTARSILCQASTIIRILCLSCFYDIEHMRGHCTSCLVLHLPRGFHVCPWLSGRARNERCVSLRNCAASNVRVRADTSAGKSSASSRRVKCCTVRDVFLGSGGTAVSGWRAHIFFVEICYCIVTLPLCFSMMSLIMT